ncbi:MAG: hypothetical protein J2P20_04945, partial [Pseudonocardia sp.]|nr:hypothetical protein [Pseudonocardia sp.]
GGTLHTLEVLDEIGPHQRARGPLCDRPASVTLPGPRGWPPLPSSALGARPRVVDARGGRAWWTATIRRRPNCGRASVEA